MQVLILIAFSTLLVRTSRTSPRALHHCEEWRNSGGQRVNEGTIIYYSSLHCFDKGTAILLFHRSLISTDREKLFYSSDLLIYLRLFGSCSTRGGRNELNTLTETKMTTNPEWIFCTNTTKQEAEREKPLLRHRDNPKYKFYRQPA